MDRFWARHGSVAEDGRRKSCVSQEGIERRGSVGGGSVGGSGRGGGFEMDGGANAKWRKMSWGVKED